jgi:hypothetical protein
MYACMYAYIQYIHILGHTWMHTVAYAETHTHKHERNFRNMYSCIPAHARTHTHTHTSSPTVVARNGFPSDCRLSQLCTKFSFAACKQKAFWQDLQKNREFYTDPYDNNLVLARACRGTVHGVLVVRLT